MYFNISHKTLSSRIIANFLSYSAWYKGAGRQAAFLLKVLRIHKKRVKYEKHVCRGLWKWSMGQHVCWGFLFVCLFSPQRWVALFTFSSSTRRDTFAFAALARSQDSSGSGSVPGSPITAAAHQTLVVLSWSHQLCAEVTAWLMKPCLHTSGTFFVKILLIQINIKSMVTHQFFRSWMKALAWYKSLTLTLLRSTSSGLCTNVNWKQPIPLSSEWKHVRAAGPAAVTLLCSPCASHWCPPSSRFLPNISRFGRGTIFPSPLCTAGLTVTSRSIAASLDTVIIQIWIIQYIFTWFCIKLTPDILINTCIILFSLWNTLNAVLLPALKE